MAVYKKYGSCEVVRVRGSFGAFLESLSGSVRNAFGGPRAWFNTLGEPVDEAGRVRCL